MNDNIRRCRCGRGKYSIFRLVEGVKTWFCDVCGNTWHNGYADRYHKTARKKRQKTRAFYGHKKNENDIDCLVDEVGPDYYVRK